VSLTENEYTTSTGRKIYVFRDVYDYARQQNLLKWSMSRSFNFNPSNEGILIGQKSDTILSCQTNLPEIQLKEMLDIDKKDSIKEKLSNKRLIRNWINANVSKAPGFFHSDAFKEGSLSLLVYLNCEWDLSWDGYTVWASDDLKKIEHIEYPEPGKVVIFDSLIPHKPTADSATAPSFRFTMNSVWF